MKTERKPTISEFSAGGVVVRKIGGRTHVALLRTEHARGVAWVLPKGHIEMQIGESKEEAAVRETKEELGIQNVILKRALGFTRYFFYTERGKISKTVYYFLLESLDEELHPQAEEGLLEAAWVPVKEALKRITYKTDRDIILRAVASPKNVRRRGQTGNISVPGRI